MKLPTLEEIEVLHRKYAPSDEAFKSVYIHCQIVAEIAKQLFSSNKNIDPDLVRAGCLLHDIGVYRLYKDGYIDESRYICHGIFGDELLRGEGLPESICRFASHHTGVGISKEQITERQLPLPHQDFFAETEEELLVMYADKFHSKSTPPRFNSASSYKSYVARFGEDQTEKFQNMIDHFGLPNLEQLAVRYGQFIV